MTDRPPLTASYRDEGERDRRSAVGSASYQPQPEFALPMGSLQRGVRSLAEWVGRHQRVCIDGYGGVDWPDLRERLGAECELVVGLLAVADDGFTDVDADEVEEWRNYLLATADPYLTIQKMGAPS